MILQLIRKTTVAVQLPMGGCLDALRFSGSLAASAVKIN